MSDEIKFATVKAAVLWSEEIAAQSHIKNTIGSLLAKPGTSTLSKQDRLDIAHTISNIVTAVKPYKGEAMKAIYGRKDADRVHTLGVAIAQQLRQMEKADGKKTEKLIKLGEATMRSIRHRELLGQRYGVNRIAKDVGISRERFYHAESWRALRSESKRIVYEWLDMADAEIWLELDVRGWIV